MLPEHFGHVTSTDAKHLTYVVAFKPASNILRKVLYCPILQMKTLRLKETGNSPTKTCSHDHYCFTNLFYTLNLVFGPAKLCGCAADEVISKGAHGAHFQTPSPSPSLRRKTGGPTSFQGLRGWSHP